VARYFRTRSTRTVATVIALVIAGVAVFKFQSMRSKKQSGGSSPTMLSAVPPKPASGDPAKQLGSIPPVTPPRKDLVDKTQPPTTQPNQLKNDANQNLPLSADLFDSAAKRTASGDLVGARKVLNDALLSGSLSAADTDTAMKQIATINQTLVFSDRRFKDDPRGGIYNVVQNDNLTKIAKNYSVPIELLLQINNLKSGKDLKADQPIKVIQGPICAVVTKSKFRIDLYLGSAGGPDSVYLTSYQVGLGSDNSTPTGTWQIEKRVWHPKYDSPAGRPKEHFEGGDPKNPVGPCWLALEGTDGAAVGKLSYGIHGTVDPDSIGKQASEGCIRLRNDEAEKVYDLVVPHKSVVVVKD
jgi:hypothetical protein